MDFLSSQPVPSLPHLAQHLYKHGVVRADAVHAESGENAQLTMLLCQVQEKLKRHPQSYQRLLEALQDAGKESLPPDDLALRLEDVARVYEVLLELQRIDQQHLNLDSLARALLERELLSLTTYEECTSRTGDVDKALVLAGPLLHKGAVKALVFVLNSFPNTRPLARYLGRLGSFAESLEAPQVQQGQVEPMGGIKSSKKTQPALVSTQMEKLKHSRRVHVGTVCDGPTQGPESRVCVDGEPDGTGECFARKPKRRIEVDYADGYPQTQERLSRDLELQTTTDESQGRPPGSGREGSTPAQEPQVCTASDSPSASSNKDQVQPPEQKEGESRRVTGPQSPPHVSSKVPPRKTKTEQLATLTPAIQPRAKSHSSVKNQVNSSSKSEDPFHNNHRRKTEPLSTSSGATKATAAVGSHEQQQAQTEPEGVDLRPGDGTAKEDQQVQSPKGGRKSETVQLQTDGGGKNKSKTAPQRPSPSGSHPGGAAGAGSHPGGAAGAESLGGTSKRVPQSRTTLQRLPPMAYAGTRQEGSSEDEERDLATPGSPRPGPHVISHTPEVKGQSLLESIPKVLDKLVSDDHLEEIGPCVQDWSFLVPFLDLTTEEVKEVEIRELQGRGTTALRVWRDKRAGRQGTYANLADIFHRSFMPDLVDKIAELLMHEDTNARPGTHKQIS